MGLAFCHHFVGNEGFGAVERVALAEGTVDAHFARAVDIYIGFGDCVEFVVLFLFVHIREDLCVVVVTLGKDSLKILSLNSSCMTTNPPELMKRSLISVNPISLQVKIKMSSMICLAMMRLRKES